VDFFAFIPGSLALRVVRDALTVVQTTETGATLLACDARFRELATQRGFAGLGLREMIDPSDRVRITIFRTVQRRDLGQTPAGVRAHSIAIGPLAYEDPSYDVAVRRTAATIVHELAHVAGAPGFPSPAAEASLLECGFADQFDATIRG
jgi:hypothetical protein